MIILLIVHDSIPMMVDVLMLPYELYVPSQPPLSASRFAALVVE
jgi:hypothetical protein